MNANDAKIESSELRYLLGDLTESEYRVLVSQDPEFGPISGDDLRWLEYKAKMFETLARGYAKIIIERNSADARVLKEVDCLAI